MSSSTTSPLVQYVRAMPKVELHVHLEGTVEPATLLTLARKNNIRLPASSITELRNWYVFRDFDHFVAIFGTICGCLQTPDDFARATYEYGCAMARQNIRYAEVTWTPNSHVNRRLSWSDLLSGINAGRKQAEREFGVRMQWIPDIARSQTDSGDCVVDLVTSPEARATGVVALGLGGPEVGFPPELFEAPFSRARQQGLHSNPHAGETVGPASIWGAIRSLNAERIGHGVRAIEDQALLDFLVEHRIPLEVSPTSNICLGVYPSYQEHPLKRLIERGICVTINSDDPALFNTTLNDEYLHAIQDCGLSVDDLNTAALDAVRVSYLPEPTKQRMLVEFGAEYERLQNEFGLCRSSEEMT